MYRYIPSYDFITDLTISDSTQKIFTFIETTIRNYKVIIKILKFNKKIWKMQFPTTAVDRRI